MILLRCAQMVTFTLQSSGYDTIEGCNGCEALKVSEGAKVDLVITDLNMPEMDGITWSKSFAPRRPSSSRRSCC